MKRRLIIAMSLLTALSSSAVLASGSIGGSAPRNAKNSEYAMGKKVYLKKIACDSCMMKGGVQDDDGAKKLMLKLDADAEGLSAAERAQVQAYLKRRFKVM